MRRQVVAVMAVGVLALSAATGCGTNNEQGTPAAAARARTAAASPKQVPITSAVSSTTAAPPDAARLVNTVCAAVRQGAPRPLARRVTSAKVARYVNGARPVLHRVEVSLRRVARQQPHADLGGLIRALVRLRGAYAAAPGLLQANGGPQHAADAIAQSESLVDSTARDAGFPACAVA